ncbi:MAG: hypothetical protein LZF61_03400 [Nitrosomonas sp.]|nr:MAG: hypothetical protein LZF61_03400 [Nitrosomonas sp.]
MPIDPNCRLPYEKRGRVQDWLCVRALGDSGRGRWIFIGIVRHYRYDLRNQLFSLL